MEKYSEVRWHGRAQQGMVTAAKVLGETCLKSGKYVQAFPEFGPERMGAPVRAYNRISDEPILLHCQVTSPGYVLIADPTLIGSGAGVTDGAPDGALYVVNTPRGPEEMRSALGLEGSKARVFALDASAISIDTIGRLMPNTPMLGALAKAAALITLEALMEGFRENYSKKYSAKVIEGNMEAMKRGYEDVREG